MGVNADEYKHSDKIVSNASAPPTASRPSPRLDDKFGIVKGLLTTTHSYTGDQRILDASTRDLRRARAAALNIVPSAVPRGCRPRPPPAQGQAQRIAFAAHPQRLVVDMCIQTEKKCTPRRSMRLPRGCRGPKEGILVADEPLVSIDFRCADVSTTIDAAPPW